MTVVLGFYYETLLWGEPKLHHCLPRNWMRKKRIRPMKRQGFGFCVAFCVSASLTQSLQQILVAWSAWHSWTQEVLAGKLRCIVCPTSERSSFPYECLDALQSTRWQIKRVNEVRVEIVLLRAQTQSVSSR